MGKKSGDVVAPTEPKSVPEPALHFGLLMLGTLVSARTLLKR